MSRLRGGRYGHRRRNEARDDDEAGAAENRVNFGHLMSLDYPSLRHTLCHDLIYRYRSQPCRFVTAHELTRWLTLCAARDVVDYNLEASPLVAGLRVGQSVGPLELPRHSGKRYPSESP